MPTLATNVANSLRALVRAVGYELTKSHRMNALLDRQDALLRLAADGIAMPAGKGVPVAEGIVFSKDRPLQLHLLLQSYVDMVANPVPLTVLYAASNDAYAKAFEEVAACFKGQDFTFVRETGFRTALLAQLEKVRAGKVFFLMDDDVFVNAIDMRMHAAFDAQEVVLNPMLSPQLTHCYTTQRAMPLPVFTQVKNRPDLREFKWGASIDMWDYPMMVDGTLFDTREMRLMAQLTRYKAPNSFEGALMEFAHGYRQRKGYCYAKAVVMNLPLNKVQTENANHAGSSGPEDLLKTWNEGLAIDPTPYYGMDFTGFKTIEPLNEITLALVPRKGGKAAKKAS